MSFSRLRESLASAAPAYLALGCFGLAASPALAQDAGKQDSAKETVRLGGVTVTDTAIDDSIKIDKVSSPKFTQPLQDTPQTVQVIDKELFNQQGATSLTEALRNTPGVSTFGIGENGSTRTGDAIYMRGFDTSNNIYIDGVRDLGSISRDIFNTDQVEVEKGPAGTDYGIAAPSGAVNMVSKQANLGNALSGLVTLGTDNQRRATVDIDHALGANAALRLNALWQNSDVPGRDQVNNKRIGLAPSLGVGLDTSTRAWLNFLYVKQDNIPDGGVPIYGMAGWTPEGSSAPFAALAGKPLPSTNFYGTHADHDNAEAYMATARIEHDFSDSVKLSNIARWGRTTQDYVLTSFTQAATNGSTDPADWTIARSPTNHVDKKNDVLTDQLNLRADFATGPVKHSLSTGVEILRERQVDYRDEAAGTRPDANLLYPDWNDADPFTEYRDAASPITDRGQTVTESFYLFDTAKFLNDSFLVTGGIRLDHYKTTWWATSQCVTPRRGSPPAACGGVLDGRYVVSADNLVSDGTLFNWKLGAVYKPIEDLSFYVDYAISQQPPGSANFQVSATPGANDPDFKPQKAKTIEAGVKWNALDEQLLVSAAVFQTTNENEVFTDPADPTDVQAGERRVKGVELSVVGNITDAWSISAGYTHLDSKVLLGSIGTADGSANLVYTPGDSATLWTDYKLPFGLELGGGLYYNAGLTKQNDGGGDPNGVPATTDGYVVVNAMVAYAITDNIKLRVNANNLFDKDYIASINKSGWRYYPGQPRTVLFTADFRF